MKDTQVMGGKWKVPGQSKCYNGELHINEKERFIVLELIIPADYEKTEPEPIIVGKIHFVTGTLFSGANVTLYDCYARKDIQYPGSHIVMQIIANYAFWGLEAASTADLLFKGAWVDFGDILNWYELCKYRFTFPDDENRRAYEWVAEDALHFQINDNLTVWFLPSAGITLGEVFSRELKLTQTIWVRLEYKNDVAWEQILRDIQSFQYLIGVGTGQKIEIEELKFEHSSLYYDGTGDEAERQLIDSSVLLGSGQVARTKAKHSGDHLFLLRELLDLEQGMAAWQIHYEKMKPVLDLLFTVYGDNGTVVTAFLSLTQALETFHSRFVTDNIREYKEKVRELLRQNENEWHKKQLEEFLIGNDLDNPKKDKIVLNNRIADLLYADGVQPLRIWCGFYPKLQVNKITNSRNYYTHYSEKRKEEAYTEDELYYVNSFLVCLLNYHLMVLLGFEKDHARVKVSESVRNIKCSEEIMTRSNDA